MNESAALDLTATVTTPENIQFEYRIAGPFRRLPALFLDLVIRGVVLWIGMMILFCSGIGTMFPMSGAMSTFVLLLAYFFLDWFYGLFFETYWNGKTPGKWLTKIQVISADGRPINAYQATVRNFLRLGDIAPPLSLEIFSPDAPPMYVIPTGLVAIICMAVTKRFQRLGDLAAGTMVVVDERAWVPPNVKLEDPRVSALAEFIPASFRMTRSMARAIALYAERRARMPIPRRMELSAILAKPLMKEFNFREDTSPDLLLCALYYREFVMKEAFTAESNSKPTPPIPNSWNVGLPQAATVPPLATAPPIATIPVATTPIAIEPEPSLRSNDLPPSQVIRESASPSGPNSIAWEQATNANVEAQLADSEIVMAEFAEPESQQHMNATHPTSESHEESSRPSAPSQIDPPRSEGA